MDSVNLSEAQNTQISCRNTASNTNPIACAYCGSEDYIQTVSQANCFRAFYPGVPKCKHFSENCEDNFTVPQPLFSSPSLASPFFYNSPVPPNLYCLGNTINLHHKQAASEIEKLLRQSSLFNGLLFSQKEKTECGVQKTSLDKDSHKNIGSPDNESPVSEDNNKKGRNLTESQCQSCPCADSVPWIFSPFIMPLISYHVLWNSQRPNISLPNQSSNKGENTTRRMNENEADGKCSNGEFNKEKGRGGDEMDTCEESPSNMEVQEEPWPSNKLKNEWTTSTAHNNGSSSSFISLNSINYHEIGFEVKKEESNMFIKNGSYDGSAEGNPKVDAELLTLYGTQEADETEVEQDASTHRLENYESMEIEKSSESGNPIVVTLSNNSSENSITDNEKQQPSSSETASETQDVKSCESNKMVCSDSEVEPLVSPAIPLISSHEKPEENECVSEGTKTNFKDMMTNKKFLKNFTLADQTQIEPQENPLLSAAAAGDLGGESCTGYRINISHPEKNSEEVQAEEHLECKQIIKENDNIQLQQKPINISTEKNGELKCCRRFKSGIAKLSNNYKSKDSPKNLKVPNKDSHQKEQNLMKRKHCCFPAGNSEKNSKILKTKNSALKQEQGSEKNDRNRAIDSKIQPSKPEKNSTVKIRQHNILAKDEKHNSKKLKK